MKAPWTETEPLPGGTVRHFNGFRDEMHKRYATLGEEPTANPAPPNGTGCVPNPINLLVSGN